MKTYKTILNLVNLYNNTFESTYIPGNSPRLYNIGFPVSLYLVSLVIYPRFPWLYIPVFPAKNIPGFPGYTYIPVFPAKNIPGFPSYISLVSLLYI